MTKACSSQSANGQVSWPDLRVPPATEDFRLAHRIRLRDPEAMGELYHRECTLVYSTIRRAVRDSYIAEDLTQEVFLVVWNSIDSFDERRGELKTWILAIARNKAVDYLRSVRGRMDRRDCALNELRLPATKTTLEQGLTNQELLRASREAVEALTARQQQAIYLRYFEGMTNSEIATAIAAPLGSVKSLIRAALIALRKRLVLQSQRLQGRFRMQRNPSAELALKRRKKFGVR